METVRPTTTELVSEARKVIEFEDNPHRAALEDNPAEFHVTLGTWLAVFFLAISFVAPIALSFITTASVVVPITTELHSEHLLTWVLGAWSMTSAVSYALAGPLSDVFGRRNPILFGEFLTIIGCITGSVAKNGATLVAAQTVTGVAIGFVSVSYSGVPEMLPNKYRALGMGCLEAGIAFPWGTVAVVLGNALQQYATWRWIYYIAIIMSTIAFIGTAFTYWPIPRPRGDYDKSRWQEIREIDFVGLFLFAGGLTTFLIGLTWGGSTGHPWKSASVIVPIIVGFFCLVGALAYDATVARNPLFPWSLFTKFSEFSSSLVIVFVAGMLFQSTTSLLPQGYRFMFTTDGIQIGVYSLPNTVMQGFASAMAPLFAHRIGAMKGQLITALTIQALFLGLSALAVYPNHRLSFLFLPAIGAPMFTWVVVLAYAIASLHIPHSQLGLAVGLVGSIRAAGGATGNAVFQTLLNNRFNKYVGAEVTAAALGNGLDSQYLAQIIPGAIQYNLDVPGSLDNNPGMTPAIQEALRFAVRSAYGHAFKMVFYVTIPFSVTALICAFFVKDATAYMTNHTQFAMSKKVQTHKREKYRMSEENQPSPPAEVYQTEPKSAE